MRLVLATKNPDKVVEIEAVLARVAPWVEILDGYVWPDVAETGATLDANALLKARAVEAATGMPALADDTGLEVDALGGAPGVHTARYAGPEATYAENRAALLRAMEGVAARAARFVTVAAFVSGNATHVARGSVEGAITTEERGEGGFGYDAVFAVDGVTLAEMPEGAKNRMSHRARAIAALFEELRDDRP